MRSFRARLLVVFALALPVASGCSRAPGRAKVVVSVFPVYDLVRRIAGPDADVALVKQGQGTADARVVVEVGLGLDSWMDALAAPKARVLRVGDRVPTLPGGAAGTLDPHVWMDPQRARLMVTAIAEEMARADASHANAFRERAAAVDASLEALDHEIEARTSAWKKRAVLSADAGMAYYGDRYHLEILGPNAARAGQLAVPLDSTGGGAGAGSYEELLRSDTAALDSILR